MPRFVYDKENLRFKIKKVTFANVLLTVLKYVLLSFAVAVAVYLVFALAFDTEREKKLSQENEKLRAQYAAMCEDLDLVDRAVENLKLRDKAIYNEIFEVDPPEYGVNQEDSVSWADDLYSMREKDLVEEAGIRLKRLETLSAQVGRWMDNALNALSGEETGGNIPAIVPFRNFSILQTGASVGKKVNPFFKTVREHPGIDLLAPIGTEVICTADGWVSDVEKSGQSFGNRVTVTHKGGYQTTYSHLSEISVRKGQNLTMGDRIGLVGVSGTTFAPCLHYEVIRNGVIQEPVNYFFAVLSPAQYDEMIKVAITTGQSMD